MKLKCKHCGHEMNYIGMPTYIEWFCGKCFKATDNYGVDLKEQEIVLFRDDD